MYNSPMEPSRLSIKQDQIIAHFRNETDAADLANRMPKTCQSGRIGTMHAVAFDTIGLNVEQLSDLLQLSDATRVSALPRLQEAVIIGNTRDALNGLRDITHAQDHAVNTARATGRSPSAPSL